MSEMTPEEFELCTSSRPGDTTNAARHVLVDGLTVRESAKKYAVLEASVRNEMSRVRAKHARIIAAFRLRVLSVAEKRLVESAIGMAGAAAGTKTEAKRLAYGLAEMTLRSAAVEIMK